MVASAYDLARQARWEGECSRRGEQAYHSSEEARDRIDGRLANEILPSLIKAIEGLQEAGMAAVATPNGKVSEWAWPVQTLEASTLAVLTLKAGLRAEMLDTEDRKPSSLSALAQQLARMVRDEEELALWIKRETEAKKNDPEHRDVLGAFRRRYPTVHRNVWARWRRKVEAQRVEWNASTLIHLGSALLRALVDAAPQHFSIETRVLPGQRTQLFLALAATTQEAMMDRNQRRALALPHLMPMRMPPIPWQYRPHLPKPPLGENTSTVPHTRSLEGGFLIHQVPLVRTGRDDHTSAIAGAVSQADLNAVNAIQATGWSVNRFILDIMLEAWDQATVLLGKPDADGDQEPILAVEREVVMAPRLSDAEYVMLTAEQRSAYWATRRADHEERAKIRSQGNALLDCLVVAEELRGEPAIYFPCVKDFRHRIYSAACRGPQPQGDDVAKSLIHFAEGKPLGDTGEFWLRVRAANCYGKDKLSLEERIAWTLENETLIREAALSPFGSTWWTQADEPWSFLATCHELRMMEESGSPSNFISHLPVAMDGSCNGIQHLSALGLDPVGAAATNLRPGPRQDIYQTIADQVSVAVDAAVGQNPAAATWLGKVERKTVKRAVMTTPYGVTPGGIRKQLLNDKEVPECADKSAAADFMRGCIVDALGSTVIAAKEIMAWLQECSKRMAKAGLPLRWETPSGSLVEQAYHDTVRTEIRTMCGRVVLHQEVAEVGLKASKQAQASAPNIIHSFDAAHLALTVNAGAEIGIGSWAMIHDSFGTHAGSSQALAWVLREQFVAIYQTDWLARLYAGFQAYAPHVQLEPPPARGSFDITEVMHAEFFFS